ncbi:MAG TPA: type II toxin-antitoxin system ParD family antitoxin [Tepidisphaeraceae bacterium]|jgi:antitoxin ParD1/3/4|nr:type II toxin-antitoxin system ParD family antitoxin [Tepidisphaeraceae bacterium]
MQITLKPEVARFVAKKVEDGQYADANDVVNAALEVLQEQEQLTPEHEAYLRRELAKGIEQLDRGEFSDFDAEKIIAEERARLEGNQG